MSTRRDLRDFSDSVVSKSLLGVDPKTLQPNMSGTNIAAWRGSYNDLVGLLLALHDSRRGVSVDVPACSTYTYRNSSWNFARNPAREDFARLYGILANMPSCSCNAVQKIASGNADYTDGGTNPCSCNAQNDCTAFTPCSARGSSCSCNWRGSCPSLAGCTPICSCLSRNPCKCFGRKWSIKCGTRSMCDCNGRETRIFSTCNNPSCSCNGRQAVVCALRAGCACNTQADFT